MRIIRPLLLVTLCATTALVVAKDAKPAASAAPPPARIVAAALDRHGAKGAFCIRPKPDVYVCVYGYRGYCVEVELAWAGSWGRFPGRVVAARKGVCFKRQTAPSAPPA